MRALIFDLGGTPDGKRLLVVKRAKPDVCNRINLVTNWTEVLERRPSVTSQ